MSQRGRLGKGSWDLGLTHPWFEGFDNHPLIMLCYQTAWCDANGPINACLNQSLYYEGHDHGSLELGSSV